jgi:tetratricopeptide (TPR) repeat protein
MVPSGVRPTLVVVAACLGWLVIIAGCSTPAKLPDGVQKAPFGNLTLRQATDLRNARHFDEAKKIFESWLADNPKDPEPTFELAYTLYLEACAETRPENARQLRLRARELVIRARALGAKSANVLPVDASIGTDGADLRKYHTTPAAEALMQQGESEFSQGNYPAALTAYQSALQIDPHCYAAALFCGDTYFAMKDQVKADEWFAKAVAIDRNRETGHRYWADSLMREGRTDEAKEQYLEALVSEPYSRLSREGLNAFARRTGKPIRHPEIRRFAATVKVGAKGPEIFLSKDVDPLTVCYAGARAQWLSEQKKRDPAAKTPDRDSLAQEVHALRAVVVVARELEAKDASTIAAWKETVETIDRLDRAGLLEAYVLLDAADADIAQDYDAYRDEHRELLLRYLREIWFRAS